MPKIPADPGKGAYGKEHPHHDETQRQQAGCSRACISHQPGKERTEPDPGKLEEQK